MSSVKKERLDVLVFNKGLAESREKAKALIMAGVILVDGEREDKPGAVFAPEVNITIKGKTIPYVSRGGLKLEKAMKVFGVDVKDKVCMDAGASTGGFTDCMLQNGAKKVYSVDVGYGQLAWKLRNDERVVCMEKTNVRYLTKDMFPDAPAVTSIDVSFISLTKVLEALRDVMTDTGEIVALIKPQFEAGREKVGKKGVVRDPKTHEEVIEKVIAFAGSIGFYIKGLDYSPVKGPEGNIEYLLYITKDENDEQISTDKLPALIKATVANAHADLDH